MSDNEWKFGNNLLSLSHLSLFDHPKFMKTVEHKIFSELFYTLKFEGFQIRVSDIIYYRLRKSEETLPNFQFIMD